MGPLIFLALSKADWPVFRVNEAKLDFQMPTKPSKKSALFHNAPATFYTTDSSEGRFVVGYSLFPEQIRSGMHKQISTDPGAAGIRSLISMTVTEFAKAGGAKIQSPQFGIDRGLPVELATLNNGKNELKIRVYLSSVATYIFVTASDDSTSDHFFDSVHLVGEVAAR